MKLDSRIIMFSRLHLFTALFTFDILRHPMPICVAKSSQSDLRGETHGIPESG